MDASVQSQTALTRRAFTGTLVTGGFALGSMLGLGTLAAPGVAYAGEDPRPARASVEPFAKPSVTYAADREADIRRVLVVVDYQVDFVDGGVFGRIEPAVAIEDALCEKIREYRDRGDIVVYTMDTHPDDDYENTREAMVNEPHCIPGTPGWEVYGKAHDLLTPENALLVMKGTYGSKDLPFVIENIRSQGVAIESIEFAGVSTTCRVLHNAIIVFNFFPELPIIFDEGTTASYTDERTAEQLDELESWGFIVKRR